MRLAYGVFLFVLACAPRLAAQTPEPAAHLVDAQSDAGGDRLIIGIAGGIGPRYEGSKDYRFRPGGVFQGSVSGFDFAARGPNLYVDLIREAPRSRTNLIAGPVLEARGGRDGSVGNVQVDALGRIRTAFELGGYVGIGRSGVLHGYDTLSADISYRHDVSGIHDSWVLTPSISYATPMSRRTLAVISASADRVGRGYGQTYFGVTPAGTIASGLPTYTIGRSGWKSVGGTLLLAQALGPNPRKGWGLFAVGGYSELLGPYRRSPIVQVGRPGQWFGFAGVAYSF